MVDENTRGVMILAVGLAWWLAVSMLFIPGTYGASASFMKIRVDGGVVEKPGLHRSGQFNRRIKPI